MERLELLGIVGAAVVVDPVAAGGEVVEAQHVHHTYRGNCSGKQFRSLVGHRAHQQAAVRPAVNAQPVRHGDVLINQILRRRDEVIEHVLFVEALACLVPALAVFAAAT